MSVLSYKVDVFKMVDFDVTGENYVSISGGRATHSFTEVETFKTYTMRELLNHIETLYGVPYIFEDRLEVQLSDSTTFSFYIEKILMQENKDLKEMFPNLEEY